MTNSPTDSQPAMTMPATAPFGQFEVRDDLVVQFLIHAPLPTEREKAVEQLSNALHHLASMNRATRAAAFCHFSASTPSCRVPASVRA